MKSHLGNEYKMKGKISLFIIAWVFIYTVFSKIVVLKIFKIIKKYKKILFNLKNNQDSKTFAICLWS